MAKKRAKSNGRAAKKAAPTTNARLPQETRQDSPILNREASAISELVANTLMSRAQLLKKAMDPRRDIDDECGYPKDVGKNEYKQMFDREGVATRVVEVLPHESWASQPSVFETEDTDQTTPFEEDWENLGKALRGNSKFKSDESGSTIWEYLRRADVQSGIGSYGVLLLGLDDGLELREPAPGFIESNSQPVEQDPKSKKSSFPEGQKEGVYQFTTNAEETSGRQLLFMRAFDESLVDVTRYESNKSSPRYGQPLEYLITFNDPNEESQGGVGLPLATENVHWSRVLHVADNLGSSEIFGVPRMRPVYNNLHSLRKLYGGSAEMYWRGAFPGLSIETHPQLGGDVEYDATEMKEQMENYMNGLQRFLALTGFTANSLAPQVVDPTPQINVHIDAICIRLGIPRRIFMGSERGELASSQDSGTWNDRLRDRQTNYLTPRIVVPFIDRLIMLGVLSEPEEYSVVWPDLDSLSDAEQADVAVKRTEALVKYIGGNVEALIPPLDFLTRFLSMTEQEAEAVLKAAVEAIGNEEAMSQALAPPEPEFVPVDEGGFPTGKKLPIEGGFPPKGKKEAKKKEEADALAKEAKKKKKVPTKKKGKANA